MGKVEQSLSARVAFEQWLTDLSTAFISLAPDAIAQEINRALRTLGEAFKVSRSYVFQFSDEDLWMSCSYEWCAPGSPSRIVDLQHIATATFPWFMERLRAFENLHIPNVTALPPEAQRECDMLTAPDTHTLVIAPIGLGTTLLGFLGVEAVAAFTTWDREPVLLLREVADLFAHALERQRADQALRRRTQELAELNALIATMTATLELEEVLQHIVDAAKRLRPPLRGVTIQLLDLETGRLVTRAASFPISAKTQRIEFSPGEGVIGVALATRAPVNVPDVLNDPRYVPGPVTPPYRALLVIPLIVRGIVVGALSVDDRRVGAFTENDVRLLQGLAGYAAIAVQNARLYEQAQQEIADRKRAEIELRQSEATNRAMLDAIPDVLFRLDLQGVCIDINTPPTGGFVPSLDNLVGNHISAVLPTSVAETTLAHMRVALETGEMQVYELQLHVDDVLHTYECRLSPINVDEVLALVRDISDRARLEQMQSDFINRASHDLRTPLTTAILMVELIRETGVKDESEKYWDILQTELQNQRELVEGFLTVGRLESGKLNLNPKPMALDPLLQETIATVAPWAQAKGIEIFYQETSACPAVIGDYSALKRVFVNILDNAIKFSFPTASGPALDVRVRAVPRGSGVSVQISDHGMGIPMKDLPELFGRFFRASNAIRNEIPGSGMGLYVVKSIVESLGGKVNVESQVNVGTTFDVWLPASQVTT